MVSLESIYQLLDIFNEELIKHMHDTTDPVAVSHLQASLAAIICVRRFIAQFARQEEVIR